MEIPNEHGIETRNRSPALMDVSKLPVEQAVSRLIAYSVMLPASDIFFSSGEHTLAINVRHLGIVMPISVVPIEVGRRYVSHVKVLAGMDVRRAGRRTGGGCTSRTERTASIFAST